ncbi:E3 ubiquitin-protein ligase bre1 [Umbelopsis nana]
MAAAEDRKRRYPVDSPDSNIQVTRQPPKKRFLSSTPTSPTGNQAVDMDDDQQVADDPNDPFKTQIVHYQKDAIYRQTCEYRRVTGRLKRKASALEADIADGESRNEIQNRNWSLTRDELQATLQPLNAHSSDSAAIVDKSKAMEHLFSHSYLWSDTDEEASSNYMKMLRTDGGPLYGIIRRMGYHLDKYTASRLHQFDDFKAIGGNQVGSSYEKSVDRWQEQQQELFAKQKAYRIIISELIAMKEQYGMTIRRTKKLQQSILEMKDECEHVLQNAQENYTKPVEADTPTVKSSTEPSAPSDVTMVDEISTTEQGSESSGVAADPLTTVRLRAASILQEIDAIKENNLSARQRADELQFALLCINNKAASDSPVCKQLEQSVRQGQERCRELSEKCERLERTLAASLQDRCKLLDINQSNTSEELTAIMDQMKSLEQDLSATRGERDNLQTSLDEKKAKMELERASVSEMKALADALQARLISVTNDKTRLMFKTIASSGNREVFELMKATKDITGTISDWLNSKLRSLEEERQSLQKQLVSSNQESSVAQERKRLATSQHYWQKKQQRLQRELDAIFRDYGHDGLALNIRDHDHAMESFRKASERKDHEIKTLEQKVIDLETVESELLKEVAGLAAGFSELEEQNNAKVDALIKKEDEIVSLQTEKLKHNQTFTALNKSKDVFKLLSHQLQRQNEMQLEVIRQYNEHEKNINAQLSNYEREMISVSSSFDLHQQQVSEVWANQGEFEERLNNLSSKLVDMRDLVKERSKTLEETLYLRSRVEEESELLKRRLDAMARVENPAEMKLAKEREEYKVWK